ncbi:hypothetical protein OIU85_025373 [Salix viminalis]|uniref:Uncharacterized protein n=1 Tax=Salix viminalis TaxID=40686 RepID=A0A9Q0TLF7_SALVM|nr:hypothetical protein OIU85_025373 [Salix viminalis]
MSMGYSLPSRMQVLMFFFFFSFNLLHFTFCFSDLFIPTITGLISRHLLRTTPHATSNQLSPSLPASTISSYEIPSSHLQNLSSNVIALCYRRFYAEVSYRSTTL